MVDSTATTTTPEESTTASANVPQRTSSSPASESESQPNTESDSVSVLWFNPQSFQSKASASQFKLPLNWIIDFEVNMNRCWLSFLCRDVLCGKLFCHNGQDRPNYGRMVSIGECKATFYDDFTKDYGQVDTGTICGDGKVPVIRIILAEGIRREVQENTTQ